MSHFLHDSLQDDNRGFEERRFDEIHLRQEHICIWQDKMPFRI